MASESGWNMPTGDLMKGKKGLIMGVANSNSIAWGIAAACAARQARAGGPLRALFLGRLDAQKGLDRLAAVIAGTRGLVEWRVVGRPVLDAPPPDLGVAIEPPALAPAALDGL